MDLGGRRIAVVVTGVSGSGKSTLGRALAERLGAAFVDADDLHPAENVMKMAAGSPLTDEDRAPWLDRVAGAIADEPGSIVVACSALRRSYRDRLRGRSGGTIAFVQLTATRERLAERLDRRRGHFMPAALLDSQLATLEPLAADEEPAIVVEATKELGALVAEVSAWLGRTAY